MVTACNGRDAIALAQHERPQVIVMDVLMPVMDGLTALRILRETPETSAIPVIMLTARGQILTRQEAETSGASLFLTKPFSPTQLLKEVAQLIA